MRSFIILFLFFYSICSHGTVYSECIRAIENLDKPDLTNLTFTSRGDVERIIKSKTPALVWLEQTNFEFSPESGEAVLFAKQYFETRLKILAQKLLSSKSKTKSENEMLDILRAAREYTKRVVEQNYPFDGVAKVMAMFSFVVDHIDKINSHNGLKLALESEVDFTYKSEKELQNYGPSHTAILGITPRLIYTTKSIDEVDLILSAYAGVFYIEKSPSSKNTFDQFKGKSSILKAAHDVGHAQSKITNITFHSELEKLVSRYYREMTPENKLSLKREFRTIAVKKLQQELEIVQNLLADVLMVEPHLRAALIITLFQHSHENADYISMYPTSNGYHITPSRIFERYQNHEYDTKFTSFNFTLKDFNEARDWLLNWFAINEEKSK